MSGTAALVVCGREWPLVEKEAKIALRAIRDYRSQLAAKRKSTRQNKVREFDMEVYEFKRLGYEDAEIGRMMGVTARSVRGALGRVENGRWGAV